MKFNRRRIIILAYCNRYLFPALAALVPMMLVPIHKNEFLFCLSFGLSILIFAVYQLVGYLLRWDHILCSYQIAYRTEMDPGSPDWGLIRKFDAYGIPAVFGVLGIALIVLAFVM
jgi:hypothetical protein